VSIDGYFIRHLGFPWEEDAIVLYRLTSPAHLQGVGRVCTGLRKPWSIEGSFVVYRGFSKEEDSTLLYKLTSPAHFPCTLSGVRQSLYRFARALCQLTVLFRLSKGRGFTCVFSTCHPLLFSLVVIG
jgi:hypothetical protein